MHNTHNKYNNNTDLFTQLVVLDRSHVDFLMYV